MRTSQGTECKALVRKGNILRVRQVQDKVCVLILKETISSSRQGTTHVEMTVLHDIETIENALLED